MTIHSRSPIESAKIIGYDANELESIPQSSILGVGCGAPTKFAHIKEGDLVVGSRFWGWHRCFSGELTKLVNSVE